MFMLVSRLVLVNTTLQQKLALAGAIFIQFCLYGIPFSLLFYCLLCGALSCQTTIMTLTKNAKTKRTCALRLIQLGLLALVICNYSTYGTIRMENGCGYRVVEW